MVLRLRVCCVLLAAVFVLARPASSLAQRTLGAEEIKSYIEDLRLYRSRFDSEVVEIELQFRVLASPLGLGIGDDAPEAKNTFKETSAIDGDRLRSSTFVPHLKSLASSEVEYQRNELLYHCDANTMETTRVVYGADGKALYARRSCDKQRLPRRGTSAVFLLLTGYTDSDTYLCGEDAQGDLQERLGSVSRGTIERDGSGGHRITLVGQRSPVSRVIFTLKDKPFVHCLAELRENLQNGMTFHRQAEYGERQGRFVPVRWKETTTTRSEEGGKPKVKVFASTACELKQIRFMEVAEDESFALHIPDDVEVMDECED